VGTSIAREISRYRFSTVLIEKESDVACGTTKANSAVIHAGYDPDPGTLKARLNTRGNRMYEKWCRELGVELKRTGSMVLAFDEEEMKTLEQLYLRGNKNGVKGLEILSRDMVLQMEPNINRGVTGALYAFNTGILDPMMLTVALADNAVENGTELMFNRAVENIEKSGEVYTLYLSSGEKLNARYIINAAGLYADRIHNMVSSQPSFTIKPVRGQYLLMDQGTGDLLNHVIFQCPTPQSKGVLVLPTVHGNLLVGPNAEEVNSPEDLDTTPEGLQQVREMAEKSVKNIPFKRVITSFSGLRACTDNGDFIIEESPHAPGFINVAGIDSPGLASAPAIALFVMEILQDINGPLKEKAGYKPKRSGAYPLFRELSHKEKSRWVRQDPRYGRVICRCENITEGDIVKAVHGSSGAYTLDGIKKRVRAGMGRCQSGFCSPRVMEIVARELGVDLSEIEKDKKGSYLLTSPTKNREPAPVNSADSVEYPESSSCADRVAETGEPKRLNYDLVVIGGGPAGMAAALEARKEGVERILLIERDRELGGILQQCIHNGFGLHVFQEELTGPEYAERFIREIEEAGIDYKLDTIILHTGEDKTVTALNSRDGLLHIEARALVLAMGCRERTRGAINLPGTRPAGVFTAGTAQRFVNMEGYLVGRKVVVFGSGDIGLIMARRMLLEGAEVAAVVERKSYSDGLTRNLVQCLEDYNIPLLKRHAVTGIRGRERVEGVTVSQVDEKKQPVPGTEWEIPCDTLLLSRGLIPENELSTSAGVELNPATGGPVVNEAMETSIEGIFACGNVVHVHDLVDWVTVESRQAGRSAARYLQGELGKGDECELRTRPGKGVGYIVPQKIRPENINGKMELFFRVDRVFKEGRVLVTLGEEEMEVKKIKKKLLTPGEMVVVSLEGEELPRGNFGELTVEVTGEEV